MHEKMNGTLIIISHQERILRIADEIVLLADGGIKAQGPREEMMTNVLASGNISGVCCREEELFGE